MVLTMQILSYISSHSAKRYLSPVIASLESSCLCTRTILGGVDQTEDVVQDEEAALAIGLEVEALGVAHGLLLLIDLFRKVSNGVLRSGKPSLHDIP